MLENFVGCEKHVMSLCLLCFDFSAKRRARTVDLHNESKQYLPQCRSGFCFFRGLFRDYLGLFLQEKDELYSAVPQL